ncbi:CHASE2 domain-containing serine/threonine-protein kinase [Nodularia spumigena CS-584]|uniref:non-specific serine/threonine protein kinase n=2 Tax=Nodularia spumigena TaxID=70799 RepID=A0A2S0Q5Z2_NODSP|nr:CHASE2 domain-containing serine/threonine-protein kinase [Nodularia spumigena]AHJ27956.1 serine/threonine kinase [Nodularia spumigena CCY9414]AVZ29833.1 serine/threonine-protein kinase C [Nodularia spumigena UHCC 0039]EAW44570.1 Serine/Threonine protein kinase with Chase2 sensor [Nodularia spumigena CCY9414]MDB9383636.1 CHASE2 domain-containing serine/threonine-protein kinase [Nodularia spumigena CS-584]MEA5555310.1 CHASE2 domain-containing serine/threonine-protein kinase [Nodularia spumige
MISGILKKLRAAFAKDKTYRDTFSQKPWLQLILVTSLGVTALVWGVRELKWLQPWELKAYDQMLRSRPVEPPDHRILLVEITQEDLAQEQWPLSDAKINQMLLKLESYHPSIIGIHFNRANQENLAVNLKNPENIISTCLFSSINRQEIPPPSNFPEDNFGFKDLIPDYESDQIIRRSLLFAHSEDNKCTTSFSFAARLAVNYLEKLGFYIDFPDQYNFSIGETLFSTLKANSGSYKKLDAAGYQILLNYRHTERIAEKVTLTQVLNNQLEPDLVKDKIVIIGTTAPSVNPGLNTPYNAAPDQPSRTPAVLIHAQIISQILSTVLDGRPLIWYWSEGLEILWLCGWSTIGSIVGWRMRHPLLLLVVGGASLAGLVVICIVVFFQAGWIPLIPPAIGFLLSGVSTMIYTTYQNQQQTKVILLKIEQQNSAIEQLNILLKDTQTTAIRDLHIHATSTPIIPEKRTGDLLLAGRYQISKILGAGGFGRTYLAKDTQRPGNPICVVKQLMPARRDTKFMEVARRLFNTEADILEVLGKHQQIPELLAYFEEEQEFYLIQEYIPGHTLNEELPPVQVVQNEAFVIDMLKGVLEVLVFMHERRIIHRDIKPTNIIRCSEDNRLVLIDFGAVKLMQPPNSEQTELATVAIGTRGYAPPEQFAGHPRLSSDIYALGMIGIQAITGILPQELKPDLDTGNILWRETAEISDELAAILDKMVRYHFSDRYQNATDVMQDLNHLTNSTSANSY